MTSMKKAITLLTMTIFSIVSADTAPLEIPLEQPTSIPAPKEPKNRTSLYVFLGTIVAATAGLLASTTHTGRHATQAEKDSKTGNIPAP